MPEFSNLLEAHSENRAVKDIAAKMGVDASMISQFTNGTKISCRPDTLMKMVTGISEDPQVQADLLRAYFRDQCTKRYKPWIKVEPTEGPYAAGEEVILCEGQAEVDFYVRYVQTMRDLKVPKKLMEALMLIARGAEGRHKFRVVIQDLAQFAAEELLEKPAED